MVFLHSVNYQLIWYQFSPWITCICVVLGVMRRLFFVWLRGDRANRLSQVKIQEMNTRLIRLRKFMPNVFVRKTTQTWWNRSLEGDRILPISSVHEESCTQRDSFCSYSPETPNLSQIWRFLELCGLEIWRMTLKNNRAPLQCYFKLCASFRSHWWFQTGVTVRKRPIWVKIDDF